MSNIETNRLRLRHWEEKDIEPFAEYFSDETNAKYVGGQKDFNEAWRYLALLIGHWQLNGFGYWAVDELSTGKFVGCVGLWRPAGWPEIELGYWLLNEYQGKGYAREAALKSKEYARDVLNTGSLVSYINPNNAPSIKVVETMGAEYEQTIELLNEGPHHVYRHF